MSDTGPNVLWFQLLSQKYGCFPWILYPIRFGLGLSVRSLLRRNFESQTDGPVAEWLRPLTAKSRVISSFGFEPSETSQVLLAGGHVVFLGDLPFSPHLVTDSAQNEWNNLDGVKNAKKKKRRRRRENRKHVFVFYRLIHTTWTNWIFSERALFLLLHEWIHLFLNHA